MKTFKTGFECTCSTRMYPIYAEYPAMKLATGNGIYKDTTSINTAPLLENGQNN